MTDLQNQDSNYLPVQMHEGGGGGYCRIAPLKEGKREVITCSKCGGGTGVSVDRSLCTKTVTVICGGCQ